MAGKNSEVKPGKTAQAFLPLECKLTEAEVREASKRLAEALNQKEAVKAKRASFLTQLKADAAILDAEIRKDQELVSSEKTFRTVECEVQYFFQRNGGEKEFHRKDTGELVKVEQITPEERQGNLV